jgi:hypothetical protein
LYNKMNINALRRAFEEGDKTVSLDEILPEGFPRTTEDARGLAGSLGITGGLTMTRRRFPTAMSLADKTVSLYWDGGAASYEDGKDVWFSAGDFSGNFWFDYITIKKNGSPWVAILDESGLAIVA